MTLEASILIPIFFAILALSCSTAISLYKEIESDYEQELVRDMWEVKNFYRYEGVGQAIHD